MQAAASGLWLWCVALLLLLAGAAADGALADDCFGFYEGRDVAACDFPTGPGVSAARAQDLCVVRCALCSSPLLRFSVQDFRSQYCPGGKIPSEYVLFSTLTSAITNASATHGFFWLTGPGAPEENATECLQYLLQHMPRRDLQVLFTDTLKTIDFLSEHVRFALFTRAWSTSMNVSWDLFLDAVLPYASLDEPRDFDWRWRPRFFQLLWPVVQAAAPKTITDAMRAVVEAVPQAQTLGILSQNSDSGLILQPGDPFKWHSETSPGFLSPRQVAQHGGSCTGTAVVLAAAARSVGIPARLAGCSESVIQGDDHHWVEFWDNSTAGPFGDNWHTKEGVSEGNAGGPWDSPSGPMLGCLKGVTPGSRLSTIWATSYGGTSHIPTLWADDAWSEAWSRVPGTNRCGTYCQAWGCSTNNTKHWSQAECGPK